MLNNTNGCTMMSIFVRRAIIIATLVTTGFGVVRARAGDPPVQEPKDGLWSTPGDGTLVMLARDANGFGADNAMPIRVQVCVTNFTSSQNAVNLYAWTTPALWTVPTPGTPSQEQARQLQLGDCVEIDRPAALIVQDATISGTASGYYRLLPESNLPSGLNPTPPQYRNIAIGAKVVDAQVGCVQLTPPTRDYATYCPIDLPADHQGWRICTGTQDITTIPNIQYLNNQYALSLLDLLADPKLVRTDKPSANDPQWNPVTPDSCRDLIGVSAAYFMVGPSTHGAYWDAANVKSVNVKLLSIDLA